MRTRGWLLAAALCATVGATGCAANGQGEPAPARSTVTVQVRNDNWSDMVVYARRNATRVRLGMVNSQATESFRLPGSMAIGATAIVLEADPIGSSEIHRSERVMPGSGGEIGWVIGAMPGISRISIVSR